MPNFNIWVNHPYPFRWEETQAIEEAVRTTFGGRPVYFQEWPFHYLSVDAVTLTTAKQIAGALKFAHRQAAIRDRRTYGKVYAEDCEVEVCNSLEGRPEWAKVKE